MRCPPSVAAAVVMLAALAVATPSQADDSYAKQIAEAIAKKQAAQFLKDLKYEIKHEQLEAVAKAVEPEKNLKVSIGDFELSPYSVKLTLSMEPRFAVGGRFKTDDGSVTFEAQADIGHKLVIEARFQEANGELVVWPRAKQIEFEVKLQELKPSDIPGGKEKFKEMADLVLKRDRDKILRQINDWLARRRITDE